MGILQSSLGALAIQAEGLELLDLAPEGLVHRDHVVELAGAQPHGRFAELAQPALRRQNLLPVLRQLPLRFQELHEGLGGGACQPLPAVLQAQPLHHARRSSAASGSSLMTQSASRMASEQAALCRGGLVRQADGRGDVAGLLLQLGRHRPRGARLAWARGEEEHLAKLSVNALIGLWARNVDLLYLMRNWTATAVLP